MKTKICFVIMGFGKKTDPETGMVIDLNKTYENIIKPSVIQAGYECIRADEIKDAGLIDKSMYTLLAHADLVIADISTANPNALYELGIRHAVRPFSTIMLKNQGIIPFDLNHNRFFTYKHEGEGIFSEEVERCKKELTTLIASVEKTKQIDSPMYEYMSVKPPELDSQEIKEVIGELAEKSELVFAKVEHAEKLMKDKEFDKAAKLWNKASSLSPNESYFIQQAALCQYKSDINSIVNLSDAIKIIEKLSPDTTTDPETLGITGAIYKQMYLISKDIESLERAIKYYKKGYLIGNSYYPGENYATCLDYKANEEISGEEKIYLQFEAKKTRNEIIKILNCKIENDEIEQSEDKKWIYATLANCYFKNERPDYGEKFEKLFLNEKPLDWEKETYYNNK